MALDGTPLGHMRLRPDTPRKRNCKPIEYELAIGSENHAHFPPGLTIAIRDASARLLITEGVRTAQEGKPTTAIAGVFDGQQKQQDGNPRELIDSLAGIDRTGRLVIIVFDSNVVTNRLVQFAEYQLAQLLLAHGAVVKVAWLPPGVANEECELTEVELDDLLPTHTAKELEAVLAAPAEPQEPIPPRPE